MFCTKCGSELNEKNRFCTKCGEKIAKWQEDAIFGDETVSQRFSGDSDVIIEETDDLEEVSEPQDFTDRGDTTLQDESVLTLEDLERELFAEADASGYSRDTVPSKGNTRIYEKFYTKKIEDDDERLTDAYGEVSCEKLDIDGDDWLLGSKERKDEETSFSKRQTIVYGAGNEEREEFDFEQLTGLNGQGIIGEADSEPFQMQGDIESKELEGQGEASVNSEEEMFSDDTISAGDGESLQDAEEPQTPEYENLQDTEELQPTEVENSQEAEIENPQGEEIESQRCEEAEDSQATAIEELQPAEDESPQDAEEPQTQEYENLQDTEELQPAEAENSQVSETERLRSTETIESENTETAQTENTQPAEVEKQLNQENEIIHTTEANPSGEAESSNESESSGKDESPEEPGPSDEDENTNEDEHTNEDQPAKKQRQKGSLSIILLKILMILLIALIIFQAALIGLCSLAPETKLGQKAVNFTESMVQWVGGIFSPSSRSGGIGTGDTDESLEQLSAIVDATRGQYKDIEEITFDKALIYPDGKSTSSEEVNGSKRLGNAGFYTDSSGKNITYGEAIITSIEEHFNNWHTKNTNTNFTGVQKLNLGEIRVKDSTFYSLCNVTYSKADGTTLEKCYTVTSKAVGQSIEIDTIKEEN